MEKTEVTLTSGQILYLMDLMMGCPMGESRLHADKRGINDGELYKHLDTMLHEALGDLD